MMGAQGHKVKWQEMKTDSGQDLSVRVLSKNLDFVPQAIKTTTQ